MSNAAYTRAGNRADDYDDDVSEVTNAVVDEREEYDFDDETTVVSVNSKRAVALVVASLMLVGVFAVLIVLLLSQKTNVITVGGPVTYVPTISGFNPATSQEAQAPAKGAKAPDFMWTEPNGNGGGNQTVSLSSFRGDKPIFLNFWGTWCPPCKAEMPEMEKFFQKHKNEISVIGISMYPNDDPQKVLDFVNQTGNKYDWKFVHDGDYSIAGRYQVGSIPSSFFIDKNGVIKAIQVGAMDNQMIESYFQQVR